MGYADRDYSRQRPGPAPSRFDGAPVVKWLLIVNIGIFVLEMFLRPMGLVGLPDHPARTVLELWGRYSVAEGLYQFQIWRFVTFQFLHFNLGHVFMNMFVLFFFGPLVERWWRSPGFLVFYLVSGVCGALFYTLLYYVPGILPRAEAWTPMMGASAGIFGVLMAVAVIAPQGRVLLFFVIPMTMRTFAIGVLVFGVFKVLTDGSNAGGEAGHLGGALAGFLMMKIPILRQALLGLDQRVDRISPGRRQPKPKTRPNYKRKLRPKSTVTKSEASEIDRILDKINEGGLHTLSDKERELLKKAAGKKKE